MTTQSDIKKLAEQMASSMNSFDDIKDFQKQLMQSFIDTALEAEMEDHLGYPKHEKADKPNKRNGHTKKPSEVTQAILRYLPQETALAALSPYSSVSIKPVSVALMTRSYSFTPRVKPRPRSSKLSKSFTVSTYSAAWFQESRKIS